MIPTPKTVLVVGAKVPLIEARLISSREALTALIPFAQLCPANGLISTLSITWNPVGTHRFAFIAVPQFPEEALQ